MTNDERLAAIRQRADAATKGPWTKDGGNIYDSSGEVFARALHWSDVVFLAHCREDIPWLLEQIAKRDAEIERLRPLAKRLRDNGNDLPTADDPTDGVSRSVHPDISGDTYDGKHT